MSQQKFIAHKQRGATLVVALFILIVLMIIGVMAMTTANTQFKLAGNLQFENMAKNNAENQIIAAESWLSTPDATAPLFTLYINNPGFTTWSSATPQLHPIGHLATLGILNSDPLNMTDAQWRANSTSTLLAPDGYLIEELANNVATTGGNASSGDGGGSSGCNSVNVFRITARGTNARGAVRFVQTVYRVLSC